MKKRTLLFFASVLISGSILAQTLPEGMISILPSGVEASITGNRKDSQYKNLVVAGSKTTGYKAFFAATETTHGEELWVTDGTEVGTYMVKDINAGTASSDISWMMRFNDKVVFAATDGTNGSELWISDGTEAGTFMVKNIHEFGSSDPLGFTQVNETQFVFGAKDFDSENYSSTGEQWWLWVSDGTEAGTQMIYQCATKYPGVENNSFITPWCRVGRKVFFKADNVDGTTSEELWVTDGTAKGTNFVKDINTETIATGTANSAIDNMVNFYNEKLFFKAFSIESSNEPWESDGTTEGTFQIYDTDPTFDANNFPRGGGVFAPDPVPYNGKIYFRGYTSETGYELASTNMDASNFSIMDINQNSPTNTFHSFPDPGVEFDGVLMFCAATGFDATLANNYGGELHYTDGNTVTMQSDMGPGTMSNWVKELTVVSGSLYWWNESTDLIDQKTKLFRIDNKSEFPVRVSNLFPDGDQINTLRNLGGDLIFTSSTSKQLYVYHYRKPGYNPATDTDNLDIEFRTRAEITGLTSPKVSSLITVYPNPTADKFQFNVSGEVTGLKIYNITGSLVKQENSFKNNSVDVASLPQGLYKLLITTSTGAYNSSLIKK